MTVVTWALLLTTSLLVVTLCLLARDRRRRADGAARTEAIARIGQRALGHHDLDALLTETTTITAELLGLERCQVVRGDRRPTQGPGTVALRLGDTRHAHGALVASGPATSDERDLAFLQVVANTLSAALERDRTERLMRHRALHDALTGLLTRAALFDRLTSALSVEAAGGRGFALVRVDLDGFKAINDHMGHEAGDQALVVVARRLGRAAHPGDTLARFAGDEFVIVCEHVAQATQEAFTRRVAGVLAEPIALTGGHVRLGASVGVALSDGSHDADRLLAEAKRAMAGARARSVGAGQPCGGTIDDGVTTP
jgi:diguanylate cyclase (GGDEF)-like protein